MSSDVGQLAAGQGLLDAAVHAGGGEGFGTFGQAFPRGVDGGMVEVLPDWSATEIWLTLYYPPYEQLPLRVSTFSDFFETHVNATCPL